MQYPVAVALEGCPVIRFVIQKGATFRVFTADSIGAKIRFSFSSSSCRDTFSYSKNRTDDEFNAGRLAVNDAASAWIFPRRHGGGFLLLARKNHTSRSGICATRDNIMVTFESMPPVTSVRSSSKPEACFAMLLASFPRAVACATEIGPHTASRPASRIRCGRS